MLFRPMFIQAEGLGLGLTQALPLLQGADPKCPAIGSLSSEDTHGSEKFANMHLLQRAYLIKSRDYFEHQMLSLCKICAALFYVI